MNKNMNLQEVFLNQARRDRLPITVILVNGYQFKATVVGFDSYCIVFDCEGARAPGKYFRFFFAGLNLKAYEIGCFQQRHLEAADASDNASSVYHDRQPDIYLSQRPSRYAGSGALHDKRGYIL